LLLLSCHHLLKLLLLVLEKLVLLLSKRGCEMIPGRFV
jgi:hypothetical protein